MRYGAESPNGGAFGFCVFFYDVRHLDRKGETRMPVVLFATWMILNASFNLEVAATGIVFCGAVYALYCLVLHGSPGRELRMWRRVPGAFLYLWYLVWQIVVANLQVMELILFPKKRMGGGQLVVLKGEVSTQTAQLILANSITLTPGTVTAGLFKEGLCVYAMDARLAEDLRDSGFARRLRRLEE